MRIIANIEPDISSTVYYCYTFFQHIFFSIKCMQKKRLKTKFIEYLCRFLFYTKEDALTEIKIFEKQIERFFLYFDIFGRANF